MRIRAVITSFAITLAPFGADASGALRYPEGAHQSFEEVLGRASVRIPVGPFLNGGVQERTAEGVVVRRVLKTPAARSSTRTLIASLGNQLKDAGFTILFECETRDCGGFDFRFETDVIDEPDMHVDLGDFRYLSATRNREGKDEFVGLLVSRSPEHGFIQVTRVGLDAETAETVSLSTKLPTAASGETPAPVSPATGTAPELASALSAAGSAVLEGLSFRLGSSELDGNPAESLGELAAFLAGNPDKTVILVGHTDASGSLDGNVALSRKRAESVLRRLVDEYGVNAGQLAAEGVGYLSPRATNATEEGRDRNRRVEAVLTTLD